MKLSGVIIMVVEVLPDVIVHAEIVVLKLVYSCPSSPPWNNSRGHVIIKYAVISHQTPETYQTCHQDVHMGRKLIALGECGENSRMTHIGLNLSLQNEYIEMRTP